MGHSKSYEDNIIQFKPRSKRSTQAYEPLIQLGPGTGKTVYLTDATPAQARIMLDMLLNDRLIDTESNRVYRKAVLKGVKLYCSIINKFNISFGEAVTICIICLNALESKIKYKHTNPFELTKSDIVQASKQFNGDL